MILPQEIANEIRDIFSDELGTLSDSEVEKIAKNLTDFILGLANTTNVSETS